MDITVYGIGARGAAPHKGKDPLAGELEEDALCEKPREGMGAEDYAYFVQTADKVPGVYSVVGGTPQAVLDAEEAVRTTPGAVGPGQAFRMPPSEGAPSRRLGFSGRWRIRERKRRPAHRRPPRNRTPTSRAAGRRRRRRPTAPGAGAPR